MPNIHVPLPETHQNIFRPIVLDVVKQVQQITDMKDAKVYFPGDDKKIQTSGGSIDSKTDRYVETTSKRMNQIEVDEEVDREEISPTFFNGKEYTPIFEDRKLGLVLCPVYAKHNVVITFNYRCGSKTESLKWLQDMRMKLSRLRDINVHSVSYHYNLNEKLYKIIKIIYDLREKQGGYNQSLEVYIKNHSTPRLTVIGNLVNRHSVFAVSERQTEIYGIFDFDALPSKPEKDEESGMWVIAFGYRFNYDKPIGCHMRYPVLVHNQPMPLELVSFTSEEVRDIAKMPTDSSRTQSALRMFRADCVMDHIKSEDGIILIPTFDDFSTNVYMKFTAGVLQVLVNIEPNDLKTLFSLKDLGDVILDQDIIEFLETEYPYICKPYLSIFHVDLYQNDVLQHYDRISIDSDLTISSVEDLDIRSAYRVRLSVVTDIDFVEPSAIDRLRQYPKALYKIISAISRAFRENPEMNCLKGIKYLTSEEFNLIYKGFLGSGFNHNYGGIIGKGSKNRDTGEIGWGTQNILKKFKIDPKVLNKIVSQGKTSRNTMILGILAFRKRDPELYSVQAGNIDVPEQAVSSST